MSGKCDSESALLFIIEVQPSIDQINQHLYHDIA